MSKLAIGPLLIVTLLVVLTLSVSWLMSPWNGLSVYNGDGALPLLMANANTFSTHDLFLWGQDRFGTWPFLGMRILSNLGLLTIDLPTFFFLLMACNSVSAICLWRLGKEFGAIFAVAFFAQLILLPAGREVMLDVANMFPWMFAAVFAFWTLLQRAPTPLVVGAMGLSATLAIWMTPVCFPYLVAILASHQLTVFLQYEKVAKRQVIDALKRFGSLAFAVGLYFVIKKLHVEGPYPSVYTALYSFFNFSPADGYQVVVDQAERWPGFTTFLFANLAILVLLTLAMSVRRGRTLLASRPALTQLALAGSLIAIGNFMMNLAADHAAINGYALRYFYPTYLLSQISILATLCMFVPSDIWGKARARILHDGLVASALLALTCWVFVQDKRRAAEFLLAGEEVSHHLGGRILLGDYWGVLPVAGMLSSKEPVQVVIGRGGGLDRMPWHRENLRQADSIMVVHNYDHTIPEQDEIRWSGGYGSNNQPAPYILEFGPSVFKHENTPIQRGTSGRYAFSNYRNVTPAASFMQIQHLPPLSYCRKGEFNLSLTIERPGELLVFLKPRSPLGFPYDPTLTRPYNLMIRDQNGKEIPKQFTWHQRVATISVSAGEIPRKVNLYGKPQINLDFCPVEEVVMLSATERLAIDEDRRGTSL